MTRRARRAAALKGWETRHAAARKRSLAAEKGWKTRRENERKRKRKRKRPPESPHYSDWLVAFKYTIASGQNVRLIDFLAFHYATTSDAIEAIWAYIDKRKSLAWIERIEGWSVRAVWRRYSKAGSRAHVSER